MIAYIQRIVLLFVAVGLTSCDSVAPIQTTSKPYKIYVVDKDTNQPITEFWFQHRTTTHVMSDYVEPEWRTIKSQDGSVSIEIPISCQLHVGVKAREYVGGNYEVNHTFDVRSDNKDRCTHIKLTRGGTVEGTIRDFNTKQPIKGAEVSPVNMEPPPSGYSEDSMRAVKTDDQGRYCLTGVDPQRGGISVKHPSYKSVRESFFRNQDLIKRENTIQFDLSLKTLVNVIGRVTDEKGQPLEGVEIHQFNEKAATTNANGEFRYLSHGPYDDGSHWLTLKKEGYLTKDRHKVNHDSNGLKLSMEPAYLIRGQVLNSEGPISEAYTVLTGPSPNPTRYYCSERTISTPKTGFALYSQKPGEQWLAVRAKGFSVWEGQINVQRDMKDLAIVLKSGVSVSGQVVRTPGARGEIKATLIPIRPRSDDLLTSKPAAQEFATLHTTISNDGSFAFSHVRADRYILVIRGKGITAVSQAVTVGEAPVTIGNIVVQGTGKIVGQAWFPSGEKRSFYGGTVAVRDREFAEFSKEFRTDEDGRFEIEGVPIGIVQVILHYPVNDLVFSDTLVATVIPNRATAVHFRDPRRNDIFRVNIDIGDRSQSQFERVMGKKPAETKDEPNYGEYLHASLKRLDEAAGHFPNPDVRGLYRFNESYFNFEDITAGTYELKIFDSFKMHASRGPLNVSKIQVGPNKRSVDVPLKTGMICGQVEPAEWKVFRPEVIAINEKDQTLRTTSWDDQGRFQLRFLSPGIWTLKAINPEGTWCSWGSVKVGDESVTVTKAKLQPGATI